MHDAQYWQHATHSFRERLSSNATVWTSDCTNNVSQNWKAFQKLFPPSPPSAAHFLCRGTRQVSVIACRITLTVRLANIATTSLIYCLNFTKVLRGCLFAIDLCLLSSIYCLISSTNAHTISIGNGEPTAVRPLWTTADLG